MSENIFYILIGAGIIVCVIFGVNLFKEWIGIIMRNEIIRTVNSLSTDFRNIKSHSDIMNDKIDSLMNDIDQLVKKHSRNANRYGSYEREN